MKIVLTISLVKFVTNNVSEFLSSVLLDAKMIAYAFPNALEKKPNALTHAHVTLSASMVVTDVTIISVTRYCKH